MAHLCAEFRLEDKVYNFLMRSPIETLEDLRFYFTRDDEIDNWLSHAGLAQKDFPLAASRFRRAWHAIRRMGSLRESDRSRVDTADLDDLLDENTLHDTKRAFWARYKLKFPAEATPSDVLVSRCSREMARRMLMVFSVWGAKSLMHQVTSSRKRRRVGGDAA